MKRCPLPFLIGLLLLFAGTALGADRTARLTLLSGESHRGVIITSLSRERISFVLPGGEKKSVKMDNLEQFTFAETDEGKLERSPEEVELELRGGDLVRGYLTEGKDEEITVDSALVGPLSFSVDDIREMRFLETCRQAVKLPAPRMGENELDVFYYRHLDHVEGTFIRHSSSHVIMQGGSGDNLAIAFSNLLLVRFADFPAPERAPGRVAVVTLSDGSRLTVVNPTSDGTMLSATTVRGAAIQAQLSDVKALYQKGGRFVYLSDLKPEKVELVPWIGEAYAWDRPRFDRSFLDTPLNSGGEAFIKGIGVISGTSLTYSLGDGFRLFKARIALDDTAEEEGDVVFEVLVDGESRFRSETLHALGTGEVPARIPPINVAGAKTLTLKVHYGDDFVRDFANWLEPMLVR